LRLSERFEGNGQIVELIVAGDSATPGREALPEWLAAVPRAWLVIPLIHRHQLLGLLVLAIPRAPRRLDDEDRDLLTTVGNQAASYIAEEETARALMDARQLEMFNQRFAFVVHDIKNLVSQLSLILSNVERHGDNPEFQRDVVSTVRHSVARMKILLEQISMARRNAPVATSFDVVALIREDWCKELEIYPRLRLLLPDGSFLVHAETEGLSQVLRHLVQNALDAVDENGTVELRVEQEGSLALLYITDDGPGMTAEFIRDTLFRPFGTTKKSGYGIGAYQARELVRRMGGRLDVSSTIGKGTRFTIQLPLAASIRAVSRQVQEA
jgi:putative PEP-CTERM system histidine kinase